MDIFLVPVATCVGAILLVAVARHLVATTVERRAKDQLARASWSEVEKLDVWAVQHGGVLERPWSLFAPRSLDGTRIACKVGGQSAWVEVGGVGPFTVRCMVAVDPALDLEIRRPTLYKRPKNSARVSAAPAPLEDEQPDVRFDVRSARDKTGELREKLFVHAGESLTAPLARLLYQTGGDFVRASDGQLGVVFSVPALVAQAVDQALRDLAEMAGAYSRKPVPLALGTMVERYLWLDGKTPRCPYCHVDIAEGEADLAACDRCRTLHHAGCFSEHGGCTLLGCGGKATLPPGV